MILNTVSEMHMPLERWSVSKNAQTRLYIVSKTTDNVFCDDIENKGNIQNIEPCDNICVI